MPGRSLHRVDAFANVAGSADALAYELQSDTNPQYRSGGGVVVFRRRGAALTPSSPPPSMACTSTRPSWCSRRRESCSTCRARWTAPALFNAGSLYLMDGEKLSEIDTESWLFDLAKRLPKGWGAWKGIFPDYARLTAATPLWKSGDGNCCPTAGRATLKLGIRDGRLVIRRPAHPHRRGCGAGQLRSFA